jgi:SNW domain-containing protein 1
VAAKKHRQQLEMQYNQQHQQQGSNSSSSSSNNNNSSPPPMLPTVPKLFVPRSLADFDDGGAFPEIHVAQYPRHMGNPHVHHSNLTSISSTTAMEGATSSNASNTVPTNRAVLSLQINHDDGQVSYDAIVKSGTNASREHVYTKHTDLRGSDANPQMIALPTPEEVAEEAIRTQDALNKLLSIKTMDVSRHLTSTSAALASASAKNVREEQTQYIQYQSNPNAPGYNPSASQRVIQMVPKQIDPFQPPKHQHMKAPPGPAEDPTPVLHAPPRRLTKEEREAWQIPACISNWKNTRGYTIPLDKRLAADGRNARETPTVNDNFATLAESLYVAEKQARKEIQLRNTVQQKLALAEKDKRENELRLLAQRARLERGGAMSTTAMSASNTSTNEKNKIEASDHDGHDDDESDLDSEIGDQRKTDTFQKINSNSRIVPRNNNVDTEVTIRHKIETEDDVAARQREKLRLERRRERERELRMSKISHHANAGSTGTDAESNKRRKLESERDVSERIALGGPAAVAVHGAGLAGDVDARLYSQNAGLSSGFGAEDEYNSYTTPLFGSHDASAAGGSSIYRPTRGVDAANYADEQLAQLQAGTGTRFQPDVSFAGAESIAGATAPRTKPVQFEKG